MTSSLPCFLMHCSTTRMAMECLLSTATRCSGVRIGYTGSLFRLVSRTFERGPSGGLRRACSRCQVDSRSLCRGEGGLLDINVMGGNSIGTNWKIYTETCMFLCLHVLNLHKSIKTMYFLHLVPPITS